jgi:hypothetical protein
LKNLRFNGSIAAQTHRFSVAARAATNKIRDLPRRA